MKLDFEYLVLGLGGFGSAAAYWLARRAGTEVLGLEQFELGHVRGESQDHSRIIRLSYHTPGYVELAKHAYLAWEELERESGEQVVLRTGGLDLGPRQSAIDLRAYSDSMDAAGVAYERLDAGEIMRRWPQWRLTDEMHGLYQEQSGIAMAARGNATHVRMAREHGATLLDRTPVEEIRPVGGEVEVRTADATYRCRRLVITAGAWSNRVLGSVGLDLPLTVTKEQVTYFACPNPADFQPERFPIWIWMDDPCFYGFPIFGEAGPKAGQDAGGRETTAETRTFEPDQEALDRVTRFLERHVPGVLGPIIYTRTCLYTLTPDRDFVLDVLPAHPEIAVAIGGGHGFKFASLVGRILSDLSIDGHSRRDLSPFRIDRPILQMKDPPRNYMV
ncbi:MAG TPA: N-methyl-L-tryptophan oxidase [Gemmatimonadales bacterium]|jgi:sarcosine oxidase|nr:N-methyl-L-tryptophan oxidase [Gemmatimonadales bacterium]